MALVKRVKSPVKCCIWTMTGTPISRDIYIITYWVRDQMGNIWNDWLASRESLESEKYKGVERRVSFTSTALETVLLSVKHLLSGNN